MNTPAVFTLNFRDGAWLTAEEKAWAIKYAEAQNAADKRDALAYLQAVRSELAQRQAQYATVSGSTFWLAGGLLEMFGGSGGAGASGLAGSVANTAENVASKAAGTAKMVLVVAAILGAGFLVYQYKKK